MNEPSAARPGKEPGRRRVPDPMLLLVAGIVLSYVVTNGVMFWFSLESPTDLVTPDYYAQSRRVDEAIAAQAASARTGWRIALAPAEAPGAATFRVVDAAGAPVAALTGAARAYRPSDAALDQPLALDELADQPGTYRARFARPRPGLWEISVALSGRGERFQERFRFVAP